jgi:hypothetical protein
MRQAPCCQVPSYVWDGNWVFNVPRGYWYAVEESLRFIPPQSTYPNGLDVQTHAYQNAFRSQGMQVCHIPLA